MKTIKNLLLFLIFLPATIVAQDNTDKQAIQEVIQKSYVDGLQNKGPVEDIEEGFHPGFELLGIRNNELTKWPIYSWIQYHENKLEEDPAPPAKDKVVTCKFPIIDVTGSAAIAKIELYRDGEKIFTDYLSLYKFEEEWMIVSKIYFRHQQQ